MIRILGGLRSLWQTLFSWINKSTKYLQIIKPFKQLKEDNFSYIGRKRKFIFSLLFYHQIQRVWYIIHDYIQIVVLFKIWKYFVNDFYVIIDHRNNVLVVDSGDYTKLPVFITWILKHLLYSIKLIIFFVFSLCKKRKLPNKLFQKFLARLI